jgi:hypothetical protein
MLPKTDKFSFNPNMMDAFSRSVNKLGGDLLNKFNPPKAMEAKELQENKVLRLGEVSNQLFFKITIVDPKTNLTTLGQG